MVVGLEHDALAIANDGDAVVAPAGQPPDERAFAVGDVDDFEAGAGVLENSPLHDAEGAPGKLNELDHATRRAWEAPTTRLGNRSVNCFNRFKDCCTTASNCRGG